MKAIIYYSVILFFLLLVSFTSSAQPLYWQHFQEKNVSHSIIKNRVLNSEQFVVDINSLTKVLSQTTKILTIYLPLPNGTLTEFILKPSSVMAEALSDKYPNIKTFTGYQKGHRANSGRFDITLNGFHGMFNYFGDMVFIEPKLIQTEEKQSLYLSYYRHENGIISDSSFDLGSSIKRYAPKNLTINARDIKQKLTRHSLDESHIRTYRMAISASGEYSQFHGGTVEKTLAELVTLINRLNEVFQRDLSVKLELVANNDLLIFTDATTDPFANDSNDGEINTAVIDDIIGNDSYDIGHIVSTGGGGLAVLGAVCDSNNKADGVTGDVNPVNDAFYIDYVAHEVGHQFGANHTFNGSQSACSGNRDTNAAYEPGSGSTIMGYAGICASQNLQSNSDAYFHTKSIEEMAIYIAQGIGSTCGIDASNVNNTPVVDAGSDYTIPAFTPFQLTGSAADADGDTLSYSWEEYDLGTVSTSVLEQVDDGSRPLFRVRNPEITATRILPQLADVLANTTTIGEVYPTSNRELNFRLLVRDANGGTSIDAMKITTVDTGEAFSVTEPLANALWQENQQVISWNVANTNVAPILCTQVDITLSSDGGINFDTLLASKVANNGNFTVNLSTVTSDNARIKVACSDNVFFAVNEGEFSVKTIDPNIIEIIGQQAISVDQGESITLSTELFSYIDKPATSLNILAGNNYTVSGNKLTPNASFSGELMVNVTALLANNTSDVFNAVISVIEKVVPIVEPPEPPKSSGGSLFWLLGLMTAMLLINSFFNTAKSNNYGK